MIFEEPIPLDDALQALAKRKLLPTTMGTDQIRAAITPQMRQLLLYSARVNEPRWLEEVKVAVDKMLSGEWNEATARQHLQIWCDKLGYTPQAGWPGQKPVPPAINAITTISSDERTHLVIQMLTRLCTSTAFAESGMDPENLYLYPAWELVRIYPKATPRGFRRGKGGALEAVPEEAWPRRWADAGMSFVDGRMIALKTNPGWQRLGDSGIFRDGTDAPYGPFWFNTGSGLEEKSREECIALGLIGTTDGQKARRVSLVSDLFDGHPERATLADMKSSRKEILDALAEMRNAA